MPVKEADPAATSLDEAFAAAMGAPAKPKEPGAPPEIDPEAPHGRDDNGAPLTPYGLTKEGKVRRSAAGRKSRDDQPRTAPPSSAPAVPDGKKAAAAAKDYSKALSETADGLWVLATFAGRMPLARLPLLAKIPAGKGGKTLATVLDGAEVRLQAQAALLSENKPGLVAALNIAAENNPRARRLAEKLETGDVTWVIVAAALAGPFLLQTQALWAGKLDEKELAAQNEKHFDEWRTEVAEGMAALAELGAAAGAIAVVPGSEG